MNRRGALGALLGAPMAAGQIAQEAMMSGPVGQIGGVAAAREISPLEDLVRKALQRRRDYREAYRRTVKFMPPHITTMKSWSPVMKAHFFAHEEMAERDEWPDIYLMDEAEILKLAIRMGIK